VGPLLVLIFPLTLVTGTGAGDPAEAEAISSVFFGPGSSFERGPGDPPLFVGSIKTVLGHSEGSAGVAGVIKASLALQHGMVPPNLLLNELSPSVRPFYANLEIPQDLQEWPPVAMGCPRRASVNSFGFGGTNAHAILESWPPGSPPVQQQLPADSTTGVVAGEQQRQQLPSIIPFNFSAASERSLANSLTAYASFVRANPGVNLRDLAWTLATRRSTLPIRSSIPASRADDLAARLDRAITEQSTNELASSYGPSTSAKPRLLGIFTGQGAQWATMGARLLALPKVARCFEALQASLDSLPPPHAPRWSLKAELLKEASESRVGEAALSQPLCTAVQIALVDLLHDARVELAAVVGHSSGEIAAAYAAGYLSAEDAIRVAYYRGLFVEQSGEDDGVQEADGGDAEETKRAGAMLAVGTSYDDAVELCQLPQMAGRICIAAQNSPTSMTLSGDADAIQDALEIMQDEQKFARLLRVDKAYHSHHMLRCSEAYVDALRNCGIRTRIPNPNPLADNHDGRFPTWISSVTADHASKTDSSLSFADTYWGANMARPVLFAPAIEHAVGACGPFDMALEIGPHPALKRPSSDTIQAALGRAIPITGTLHRNTHDVEAVAAALGALWQAFGDAAGVDFAALDRAVYMFRPPRLLKNLPPYPWTHDRTYWHASRSCEALFRATGGPPHPLLGTPVPDGLLLPRERRFRNRLTPREVPWLVHHRIHGQIVFPASGYVAAVVEAVARMSVGVGSGENAEARLVEISDLVIGKALVFPDEGGGGGEGGDVSNGIETVLSVRIIHEDAEHTDSVFSFCSGTDRDAAGAAMTEHASGKLRVVRGGEDALPLQHYTPDHSGQFLDLEPERFYTAVGALGHEYQAEFKALSGLRRKMNEATGRITVPGPDHAADVSSPPFVLHPATLDCAIQAILVAYCYPGDGRLRSPHMPTKIERLRIDLAACQEHHQIHHHDLSSTRQLSFFASVAEPSLHIAAGEPPSVDLVGDVEMHAPPVGGRERLSHRTIVQLQGLHATPLDPPSAGNDAKMFFETHYGVETPTPARALSWEDDKERFADEHAVAVLAERAAYFFLRRLVAAFPPESPARDRLLWHHKSLLEYADHCLAWVKSGTHPYVSKQSDGVSGEDVERIMQR
jgi:hybrid polyketide synthase/nonribosomal peptide synthetase ACE1